MCSLLIIVIRFKNSYSGKDGTTALLVELVGGIEEGPIYCGGLGVTVSDKSPKEQTYEVRTIQMAGLPNIASRFTKKDLTALLRRRSPI